MLSGLAVSEEIGTYNPPMTSGAAGRQPLGQRVAFLRAQRGWTQVDLAARVAVSRVAISHFEMGLAMPSERTVVLLAGLFKQEPHELVAGTDYPLAKSERLPLVACRYTEVELHLELLRHDLDWLTRLPPGPEQRRLASETLTQWAADLASLDDKTVDRVERDLIRDARKTLACARTDTAAHGKALAPTTP